MSAESNTVTAWSLLGQHARVRFDIVAEQAPGLLPRLVAPFARRDLAPDSLHAERLGRFMMHVQIGLEAVPADQLQALEGNLRQIVGVTSLRVQREITGLVRRAG